ncbi:MAG: c-type cytochrome [Deltaproteobacteria bacterium]|nr:c-type cytochrome [Deltaproteobacteria bacterium]
MTRPVELQSRTPHFFAAALLLAAVTVWAVHDELETRRPWKAHQRAFFALEVRRGAEGLPSRGGERQPELSQIWLPELDVVDRCTSCHLGIDRPDYGDPEEIVAFANEVMDRDGEEAEVERRFGVPWATIEGWMDEADRGEVPRQEVPRLFRSHPHLQALIQDAHPFERFGCTPCHEGQGPQTKGVGGWLDGRPFDHGRNDPHWERPMLSLGSETEPPYVQATCPDCHGDLLRLPFAETLQQGQALARTLACWGCHPIEGLSPERRRGPTLEHLRAKTTPGWIAEWLRHPAAWREGTTMPNLWPEAVDASLPEGERASFAAGRASEVEAITAFLWQQARGAEGYLEPAPPAGEAARGRALVDTLGCRGCHAIEPDDPLVTVDGSRRRSRAPRLSGIGAKTSYAWLFSWLRGPSRLWPDARMPDLRLEPGEAADLAAYLAGLGAEGRPPPPEGQADAADPASLAGRGEELVAQYGCFGCHAIRGFEEHQRVGPDLSRFGEKPPRQLAWGEVGPTERSWHTWTSTKLTAPRAFRTERIETRMPSYELDDDELRALLVFLRSRRARERPPSHRTTDDPRRAALGAGEELIHDHNCRGCHRLGGEGGQILSRYLENPNLAPPTLFSVGAKTRPDWLFHYLKDPSRFRIRPYLTLRMPTFAWREGEATRLVAYFNALDGSTYPYLDVVPQTDADTLAQGQAMFEKLRCTQCHLTSATIPPNTDLKAVAPNLANAHFRLRPDWVPRWIHNPATWLEGARMPTFWPDGLSPFPELLGGDADRQMEAVRDHVLSIGAGGAGLGADAAGP